MQHPDGFISDRSTLDCIAYWKFYLKNYNNEKETQRYIMKARLHAWRRLDMIVYVPPLIQMMPDTFRLTVGQVNVDSFIQEEIKLVKNKIHIIELKSNSLDRRQQEVLLAVLTQKGYTNAM